MIPELLESIYSQNMDHSLFEVWISDNFPTDETKEVIEKNYSIYYVGHELKKLFGKE